MTAVEERARALHARGLAATGRGRSAQGCRLFRAALALLDWPETTQRDRHAVVTRILISLAAAEVHLGRSEVGFALLDDAEALAEQDDRGILLLQRGLLCVLVGRMDEALHHLNEGISALEGHAEGYDLASALLNRAMLHSLAGRARLARADLLRCGDIARRAGLALLVAKSELNRGYCEMLMGDIPAALRAFDLAKPEFTRRATDLLPVLAVDRARTLMQAGLADEAAAELDEAIRLLGHARPTYERAEAALTRAQVALVQGDHPTARLWARRAERCFLRRGDRSWAAVATLTRLRADFRTGRRLSAIASEAAALALRLRGLGLPNDAEAAALLAARVCVRRGDLREARRHMSHRRSTSPVLETKLLRRLTAAELHAAEGDTGRVYRDARAGLDLLHDHRARLASLDLRTGTAALGAELAAVGLGTAVRHSRVPVIFAWSERSRAQAFLVPPVRPPTDVDTSDAVAELRQQAMVVRAAELSGRPDPGASRRCAELEHVIRARGWQADGDGERTGVAGFHDVAAELGRTGEVMVTFLPVVGQVLAVVIADGRGRVVRFGDLAAVSEAIARLRSDLDAICGRTLPLALAEVITASIRHQLAVLDEHLLRPLGDMLVDRDLVVVPTGPLSGIPWGLLPPLRGRPVTVAASASAWLQGRRAVSAPMISEPLLVAGPHLRFAAAEISKIAGMLPASTVLTGADASVDATLAAMDNRRIVHVAAHGHHEPGNFLFSRLDLADGPLMAYDISRLPTAPQHVVLSSCDTGRTVMRVGDEMLGFAAAFLYSGTKTVVAGVARVPDDTVTGVMAAYHDLLLRGARPSRALAEAAVAEPLIPLVCFGSC
ncbi:CHAT domain-containing protein [Lentzea tibetensis]|uniref:CHAT domain-containing protein n=1 Tax=Lentzea tibetensis TaxID=2591470 RepID=A0A563EVP3_9PSEU|nr:CHAT domain-containing protein [Lentzea tibetensis]TWP51749.1 CHAT domain-containing protein [Lentzea tibetensis]